MAAQDNVFIGDLPESITQDKFENIMRSYGSVNSCRVLAAKNGKASGLCRFGSVEEAQWVVDNLNGNLAEGLEEPIIVRFANAPGGAGGWKGADKGASKGAPKGAPKGAAAWGGAWGDAGGKGWGAGGKGGGKAAGDSQPQVGDNVFVGDLPEDLSQDVFDEIMKQYGTVTSSRVMPPKTPGGRASALVRFASVEEATWIVENLNGNLAEGLQDPIKVRFANAPGGAGGKGASEGKGWSAPAFAMSPYGKGAADKGFGKGGKGGGSFYHLYGAIKKSGLLGDFSHVPDENQLFVKNLPADTTDHDLYRLFSTFGAITPSGAKAMMNDDGTCKGIGFIDFADHATAEVAAQTLNGFSLPDGTWLGVSIKNSKGGAKGAGKSAGGK